MRAVAILLGACPRIKKLWPPRKRKNYSALKNFNLRVDAFRGIGEPKHRFYEGNGRCSLIYTILERTKERIYVHAEPSFPEDEAPLDRRRHSRRRRCVDLAGSGLRSDGLAEQVIRPIKWRTDAVARPPVAEQKMDASLLTVTRPPLHHYH